MARILLVEDDVLLSQMIVDKLTPLGFAVEVTHNGKDALAFVGDYSFDLLMLDWDLPEVTGLEICKFYRQKGATGPVLFLTAKTDIADKEAGLDSGADDYLTKPFDMRELIARVKSLLRRPATYVGSTIRNGDLELELETRELKCGANLIRLQPREIALLEFLMRRVGQVLNSETLLAGVWGSDFDGSEIALRSCLAKLRKALAHVGQSDAIETVHGFGYRMKPLDAK